MKRLAVLSSVVALFAGGVGAAQASTTVFFQGFESDTTGWTDYYDGSISRVSSGYSNGGGYADGIPSASGGGHARLRVTPSPTCTPGVGYDPSVQENYYCVGPYTHWDQTRSTFPEPGYETEAAIYLDTSWAATNPDYRFDWDSSINDNGGNFLQDYAFNVSTQPSGPGGFFINAGMNASRSGANPQVMCPDPIPVGCRQPVEVFVSGWYTFRHTFTDDGGQLKVEFKVLDPSGNPVPGADWVIYPGHDIAAVGGNRSGWFANQEINDLPIDNTTLRLLATPPPPVNVTMGPQAMEGDLKVKPGDVLKAGYDFTMPGKHDAATVKFSNGKVTFNALCVKGGGGGTITVDLTDQTYAVTANSSAWYASGDQKSPLTFQGSTTVPDLCAGGQMTLKQGGTFTSALQSSDTKDKVNIRWHYSANGSAGGWSGTKTFIPNAL